MAAVVLRLYVNGGTARSELAQANLRRLLTRVGAPVDLEVIDIIRCPEVAEQQNLLATPTLVRVSPLPVRRIIGDLSDIQAVGDALGLAAMGAAEAAAQRQRSQEG